MSAQQDVASQPRNRFVELWLQGYRRLVPIVPCNAELSERSTLCKRPGSRGKAVGIKGRDGKFFGFDWLPYEACESDLTRWHRMGCGTGVKTGLQADDTTLLLIDADTLNEEWARIIEDEIERRFGILPVRIGRYPKAGYVIRIAEAFQYRRVEFGELDERGQHKERVEILSDGRQFVAFGQHPTTQQPYYWPVPLPPFAELKIHTADEVMALLEALRGLLPAAKAIVTEGSTSVVNQAALRGDPELVRKAVRCIPNTAEAFPTRESYRDFGYAIKAALPDNEEMALELFQEWCADSDWTDEEGRGNDPAVVEADWRRMKPPFRRGAGWLYELAEAASPDRFSKAEQWWEPIKDYEPLFPDDVGNTDTPAKREPLKWIDPTTWEGKAIPERQWEVENWIPRHEVTTLYGDGGTGKTLLIHLYATCAATGRDWLGQKTRPARVMCFFCEDSEDELHRRQKDINAALGIRFQDLGRLRLLSRKYADNLLALWDQNTGAMKLQAVWEQLLADALAFRADVIVVDTLADTYGGNEVNRAQVNAFVKSCLGRLAQEIGGSVIALGHPSLSGKASGQGTSGSTAWSNAVRSRLFLRYPKGTDKGNIRELEGMKLNYGPKGSLLKLRWNRGVFEVLAGTKPAQGNTASPASSIASIEDAAGDAVVSALLSRTGERLELNKPNSTYFAPKVLKRLEPETLSAFSHDEVEAAMRKLETHGIIRHEMIGRDSSSRPIYGFVVVQDKLSNPEPSTSSLFD